MNRTVSGWADRIARCVLATAYRMSVVWERLRGRHRAGAAVVVRQGTKILLVRHSYRPGFGLPGGNIEPGEAPAQAAARELGEEVGIIAEPADLIPIYAVGELHVFEYRMVGEPIIRIDNREIIEAAFMEGDAAMRRYRDLRHLLRSTNR